MKANPAKLQTAISAEDLPSREHRRMVQTLRDELFIDVHFMVAIYIEQEHLRGHIQDTLQEILDVKDKKEAAALKRCAEAKKKFLDWMVANKIDVILD